MFYSLLGVISLACILYQFSRWKCNQSPSLKFIFESDVYMLIGVTIGDPDDCMAWISSECSIPIYKISYRNLHGPGFRIVAEKDVAIDIWKHLNCKSSLLLKKNKLALVDIEGRIIERKRGVFSRLFRVVNTAIP